MCVRLKIKKYDLQAAGRIVTAFIDQCVSGGIIINVHDEIMFIV